VEAYYGKLRSKILTYHKAADTNTLISKSAAEMRSEHLQKITKHCMQRSTDDLRCLCLLDWMATGSDVSNSTFVIAC
jgi:hypothetical protein